LLAGNQINNIWYFVSEVYVSVQTHATLLPENQEGGCWYKSWEGKFVIH